MEQIKQFGTFVGYLSEKKLVKKQGVVNNKCNIPCEIISGGITIRTAENDVRYLSVYCTSKTAKNNPHPFWESINTMYDEYKSEADVANNSAEYASYIMVNVTPAINDYKDKQGNMQIGKIKYNVNTAKRVDKTTHDPIAQLRLNGYLNSVRDEVVNGENTGRQIMEIVGVDFYGNAEPFTIYVNEAEEDYFDYWEIGDMVNATCLIENHVSADVGAPQTSHKGRTVATRTETQIVLDDWMENRSVDNDDDDIKEQNRSEINKALDARKLKIEALKSNSVASQPTPQSTKMASVNATIDDDDDDFCPF